MACVKPDGISALVGLLSAKSGSYDKNMVYQILSHPGKSTELRYVILGNLVALSRSNPEDTAFMRGKNYMAE